MDSAVLLVCTETKSRLTSPHIPLLKARATGPRPAVRKTEHSFIYPDMSTISIGTAEVLASHSIRVGGNTESLTTVQVIALFVESLLFGGLSVLYPIAVNVLVPRLRIKVKNKGTHLMLVTATTMYILAIVVCILFYFEYEALRTGLILGFHLPAYGH